MKIEISLSEFLLAWHAATPVERTQAVLLIVVGIATVIGILIDAANVRQRFLVMRWLEGKLDFLDRWGLWSDTVQRYAEEIIKVWALEPCAGMPVKDKSHNWKDSGNGWECKACHATMNYGEEPWIPKGV